MPSGIVTACGNRPDRMLSFYLNLLAGFNLALTDLEHFRTQFAIFLQVINSIFDSDFAGSIGVVGDGKSEFQLFSVFDFRSLQRLAAHP